MTDSPEVVAHADLSPASPKPIHHTATSPALIPSLQDTADTLDVAYLDSLVPAAFPFVTMSSVDQPRSRPDETMEEAPAPVQDTTVEGEDDQAHDDDDEDSEMSDILSDIDDESLNAYGEEDHDNDEKSLDAYGEEDHDNDETTQEGETGETETSAQAPNKDGDESSNSNNAPGTETGGIAETAASQPDEADEEEEEEEEKDVSETSSISIINDNSPSPEPDTLMESESPAVHPPAADAPSPSSTSLNPTQANDQPPQEQDQAQQQHQEPVSAGSEVPSTSAPQTAAGKTASGPNPDTAAVLEEQNNSTDNGTIDIQKLVDDITARAAEASSESASQPKPNLPAPLNPSTASAATPSLTIPPSSSLPAKPTLTQQPGQSGPRPEDFHPFSARGHNSGSNSHGSPSLPGPGSNTGHGNPNGGAYMIGAPGILPEAASSLPPHPHHTGFNGSQHPHSSIQPIAGPDGLHGAQLQQAWDAFQADEKRYMTEAKWERFPDNSRIFIGNLSADRVPKKEVFDMFHRYGRLAQISLKSAYGFVQYHSAEDAARAMAGAQEAELGGRRIHLEFSKIQKKRDPNEVREPRDYSPDRRGGRGGERGGRGGVDRDRYEPRDRGDARGRDDYRPVRSPSPRRGDGYGRPDRYQQQHGSYSQSSRGRSRSPNRFGSGRYDQDSYRRRSPSPRRRSGPPPPPPEPELDIPRRYGDQVPDVQVIVLGEVDRNFVAWLPQVFQSRGLRPDVMFVNPHLPRDSLLSKCVLEGVHGVVELDVTAQHKGKIPLRVFDRSAGINNVRFDQYQDLDPLVAAEVVLRAKHTQAPPQPQLPPQPAYPPNPYPQQPQQTYPPQHGVPPVGYPGYHHIPAPVAQPQAPPAHHGLSAQDIAGLAGKVDNATLQALLASLGSGASAQPRNGQPPTDVNALLASISQAVGTQPPSAMPGYGYNGAYAPPAANGVAQVPQGSGDAVKDIMATLARTRYQ